MKRLGSFLTAWWRLSRVPFLSVGILPLILGFVLAWRYGYSGPLTLYILSTFAVVLILWMTYYLGEWNDLEGDRINQKHNRFSGGSRILVEGILPPWFSLIMGYGCLIGALLIGFYIYLQYQRDYRTLILGGFGIFSGFFYSGKPLRISSRGWGEILIGFCYGWLPIATGFFLLTGFFSPQIYQFSIPIGLSIFNVILINEFPDEEADRIIGKRNLVVRFGKERMGDLYVGISVLAGFSFIKMALKMGSPSYGFLLLFIPSFLILWNIIHIWKKKYQCHKTLEHLCRNTLLINLSMTLLLTLQLPMIRLDPP